MNYSLENLGQIDFERIESRSRLETALAEVRDYLDLHSSADQDFAPDKAKLQTQILDLFDCNALAATLLKFDGQIISAYFCRDAGQKNLELLLKSGSPFYEIYAPHELHSQILETQGFEIKESAGMIGKTTVSILPEEAGIKWKTLSFYLNPATYRIVSTKLKRFNLKKARRKIMRIGNRLRGKKRTMNIYRFEFGKYADAPFPAVLNRNSVADLLKYQPTELWHLSVSEYHREVLKRMRNGAEVYTLVENDVLVYTLWHCRNVEISAWEVRRQFRLPEFSTCLFDAYTHPQAREKKIHQHNGVPIMADIFRRKNFRYAFAAIHADNVPSICVAEKVGGELWTEINF